MGIKTYKPYTSSRRFMTVSDFSEITRTRPEKRLTVGKKRISGRNNQGRITVRRRGGGHKRRYRIIDFKRDKLGIQGEIVSIEYDPNRSARIALVKYVDGDKRYIIAPQEIKVGDTIICSENAPLKVGNRLPLRNIPEGTFVHNIETLPGNGGKLVRSAGTYAQILAKDKNYCQLKMPSGEIRLIHWNCYATIGMVSNPEHENIVLGKAGRMRWLGRRPRVRGVAMNPIDHPHGGGEGKAGQGNPHPVSPWGLPTKGFKTRKKRKITDRLIIKRRK